MWNQSGTMLVLFLYFFAELILFPGVCLTTVIQTSGAREKAFGATVPDTTSGGSAGSSGTMNSKRCDLGVKPMVFGALTPLEKGPTRNKPQENLFFSSKFWKH